MEVDISVLLGKTLSSITKLSDSGDNVVTELIFGTDSGKKYRLYHDQDCCEYVYLYDIEGNLDDLIGSPILQAEESISKEQLNGIPKDPDSFTWTFYKLATSMGYVTLRWIGESNGYYSESVNFCEI